MSTTEVEKKLYQGNCHCGAFKFSVKLAQPLTKAHTCNCSICRRKGYVFVKPENTSDFKVEAGEDVLKTYQFNNNIVEHKFCPTCGTAVLVAAPRFNILQINANTFKHGLLDINALDIGVIDYEKQPPAYKPFTPPADQTRQVPENSRLYAGSCHCQAVKYTVTTPEIKKVTTCNCSFCGRNADMWIYPQNSSVDFLGTEQNLTIYTFGTGRAVHGFCGVCGVDVVNQIAKHPQLGVDLRPVNVRTIDAIDFEKLEVSKVDGWARVVEGLKPYDV